MPIRLVVLPGDALEADVKAGKTFFRDSKAAEKTGTMPTKAIVAGAETYEEGYHAGDVDGLSAIDTDLAPGNIKKDTNIFGKVGTYEPTVTFTQLGAVTEAQNTENNTWEDMLNVSVPANAKRVLMAGDLVFVYLGSPASSAYQKGYYNGVERWSAAITTENYDIKWNKWSGDGVGSEVTARIESKTAYKSAIYTQAVIWEAH